jgi:hypothetical protein
MEWTARKLHLLLASYLFYAAWNPPFVILLWISTAVDWWAAHRLAPNHRKILVGIDFSCGLHISLASWLRDYWQIARGGNRRGALRTRIKLRIAMRRRRLLTASRTGTTRFEHVRVPRLSAGSGGRGWLHGLAPRGALRRIAEALDLHEVMVAHRSFLYSAECSDVE